MRVRRAMLAISALLAATAPVLVAPLPAYAATCTSAPPVAEPIRAVPWAQTWLATPRLSAITEGLGVVVAVIDSGVDARHPQLRGQVLRGRDFLDPGPGNDGRTDCVGHGTAVASIIAATRVDGIGLRGVAPGVKILPVRVSEQQVIDGETSGRAVSPEQFATAIRWAVDNGADVLNLSVVLYDDVPAVRAAIAYAVAHDVVVVAAVGNLHERGDPRPYPAAYDGVVGVGAMGQDGLRQPFSQVGSYVDLVAPGGAITVAVPGRGHAVQTGTSYATPFVSATAALVRREFPDLNESQVRRRLVATADPAAGGRDSDAYGAGAVNPYRATVDITSLARQAPAAPLPEDDLDPAAVAAQERLAAARTRAIRFAVAGAFVAVMAILCALVLPRAQRRGWRAANPGTS